MSVDIVSDIEPRVQYTAVAAQTDFDYPFPIFADGDLVVDVDGVTQALTTDYTVTGEGEDTGGTVTFLVAMTGGEVVTIYRDLPIERTTDFQQNGRFSSSSFNDELDKIIMIQQQLDAAIGRALRVSRVDATASADMELPSVANRASKYLYFNASGDPEMATAVTAGTTLSQSTVGTALYTNQTALELAHGVTPSDPYWPTGHVRRYGVTLDGVTDDSTALQEAADFCRDSGVHIIGDTGTAKISTTFVLQCAGDLSMMTVSCPSTTVSPAVRVGVITAGPTQLNGSLKLPKVVNSTKPGTGWASQQIGVELAELYQADIYVPYVYGFAVGLDCGGYTSGFAYNTVKISMLSGNKIPIRVGGKTTSGWANQNVFIGGRLFISSSEGSLGSEIAGSRYIQLTPTAATSTGDDWPNNNTFIGQTLEFNAPEYLLEISGQYNQFIGCRFEATAPPVLLTGHASSTLTAQNQIIGGYNAGALVFTKSGICLYNEVLAAAKHSSGGSGVCWNIKNESSSSSPLIQGFPAGATEQHLNADTTATEWSVRLAADFLWGKATGDAAAVYRAKLEFATGKFHLPYLGDYANDAAAAAGGIALGQFYRNGSIVMVRVA